MSRTLAVAVREYQSTVLTKGFIIGAFVVPLIMTGLIFLIPSLISDEAPPVRGSIALVDRSGWEGDERSPTLGTQLAAMYAPAVLEAENEAMREALREQVTDQLGERAGEAAAVAGADRILGEIPEVTVEPITGDADVEALKQELVGGGVDSGGRLAVVVIADNAVTSPEVNERGIPTFGSYELFLRENLDRRFEDPLDGRIRQAIVSARIAAAGEQAERITALTTVTSGPASVVSDEGERESDAGQANVILAIVFIVLLMIGTMTGGQYLMTTVIEEKASRVMEVLLSAVSPTQLMTGKIIGQLCVASTLLIVYLTISLLGMRQFDMFHVVQAQDIGILVVFFVIAFILIATLMAAIGSAVNEMREAQALLGPVMMLFMIPWFLWLPFNQSPNAPWVVALSMIPPLSPFIVVLRLTGTEAVPMWQIAVAIAINIVAVLVFVWATAKIFRIGVLMYGKPPSLGTLIKWIRMA